MKKSKILNIALAIILVASAFGILFGGTAAAQEPTQNIDVSVKPEQRPYSQGMEIEIELAGHYPRELEVAIINQTDNLEPFEEDAHWTGINLDDDTWTTDYQIPEDAEDGEYWVVVSEVDQDTPLEWEQFQVQRYMIDAGAEKNAYLPREEVTVHYTVIDNLDGSEYTDVDVEYLVEYDDTDGETNSISDDATNGEFTFTLPRSTQINQEVDITVFANSTDGEHEIETTETIIVRGFSLDLNLDQYEYLPEETLYVDIQTSGASTEVELELLDDDDQTLEERTVETDSTGHYTATFDISDYDVGVYKISGGASWDLQRDITDSDEVEFEIVEEKEDYYLHLRTDESTYYPGGQGTVFYEMSDQTGEMVEDITAVYTLRSTTGKTFDKGHGENGEIEFEVPSALNPAQEDLVMEVRAGPDRENFKQETETIDVSPGEILLNSDKDRYQPDDTIQFEYSFSGIDSGDIDSLEYKIYTSESSSGTLVESETPSGGGFDFQIPAMPEDAYYIELRAITNNGVRLDSAKTITRVSDYSLKIEIISSPDYTTGYQPGEEIEIDYELVSNTDEPLPDTITINYGFSVFPTQSFTTDEMDGTFTMTVPEVKSGTHMLFIQSGTQFNYQTVDVDSDPSMMDRSVMGDISIAQMTMAILVLIALILGGAAFFGSRSGNSGFEGPKRGTEGRESEPPSSEQKEVPVEGDEGSGEEFVIEEGEAEPEDQWTDDSQIEPGDRE